MLDYETHTFRVGDQFKQFFTGGKQFNGTVKVMALFDDWFVLSLPGYKRPECEKIEYFISNGRFLTLIKSGPSAIKQEGK
jgi:hypothetical protein